MWLGACLCCYDWSGLAKLAPNRPVEPQWSVAVHREASHASIWPQISIKEAVQSAGSLVSSNFLPWRRPINCPHLICGLVQQALFLYQIPDMFPRMQLVLCHYIKRHMSSRLIPGLQLHKGKEKKREISMEISCLQSPCLKGAGRCLRTLAASQTEKIQDWFPRETHIPPCNVRLGKYHMKGI